ncbi:glycosyltransferase [Tenacibaculum maritimum]|uniref:glycosyltransferase n=1 Tax=Tenacibaculum maritimum TaxID=107401 RepID=UPI0012E42DEE|nr:glycosyltransferase [Tenacibaculum maritimum]MCD9580440.1 glycosyltransferase [Tenacibaculum maritimum]MCD9635405.1 glycosyltransferase [Tenacibaculum maritimum]CAA0179523.1 Bimodular glycosyltransferase, family GT2 [Tenacibaculum maritimum]CAA0183900.1 Bimodular glycosyltransferase, family GT2 [Tenacibaculum maritimum]
MKKITIIIPTLNEESNIQRALDSVAFADEIIVIDSFSSDRTVEIVKNSKAVLLQRKFDDFSSQKNYAIAKASNEWILLLDADEEVTQQLQDEILKTLEQVKDEVGYYIYRKLFFRKKNIRFSGFQRSKVIRLFRKDICTYKGKVHETIVTDGIIGQLTHRLNHYSYKSYTQYRAKLDHYAKLQAEELFAKGSHLTFFHLLFKPIVRFLLQYIFKLGFLDGISGFVISYLHGYGVFMRYLELLKLKYASNILKEDAYASIKRIYNEKEKQEVDVSIIIVNYKSWKHLRNCLPPLEQINTADFSLEVIVVDNYSDDGKLAAFSKEFTRTKFVENSGNNGFANGCNVGAKNSNGKYLLFLNPDAIASKEAISKMLITSKKHPNYGIVSCSQVNSQGKPEDAIRIFPNLFTLFGVSRAVYRRISKGYKHIVNSKESIIFPNWVSGSTIFISRDWLDRIGGWNEDYWMYYEDVDLSKKVTDLKGKVALLKNAQIIHNHGGASRINVKTAALTKSEVLISKHIYVNTHFSGLTKYISQFLLVTENLVGKLVLGGLGFILFFIPKLSVQWFILVNMVSYYLLAIQKRTWLSKRSINFKK